MSSRVADLTWPHAGRRRTAVLAVPVGSTEQHGRHLPLSTDTDVAVALAARLAAACSSVVVAPALAYGASGEHAVPLARAVRRLRSEGRDVRAWSRPWRGDAPAGRTETSVQLALAPDRVRMTDAERGTTTDLRTLLPALQRDGVRAVSANGVLGDPAGASADEGGALLAAATDALVELVAGWCP